MYLSPTEEDRLQIFLAAQLARRTLADGVRLSAPEATALICDEMHRAARAGGSMDAVLAAGRAAIGRDDLIDGVPALLSEIRLEVLLDDGMRLVVLRDPVAWDADGAQVALGAQVAVGQPGEIRGPQRQIPLATGRPRLRIRVTSSSRRPIRVSSHYPFWRVNPRLEFDRAAATGYRLDIPAGASIRWAPGEVREVDLVAFPSFASAGAG
jgi:urease subunit gamma/beta